MSSKELVNLLPIVLLVVVFYLLLIRPARTKARRVQQMQSELAQGSEIMTSAGLYATVIAIDGDVVVLETSPGVHERWARAAVTRVLAGGAPSWGTGSSSGAGTEDDPPTS